MGGEDQEHRAGPGAWATSLERGAHRWRLGHRGHARELQRHRRRSLRQAQRHERGDGDEHAEHDEGCAETWTVESVIAAIAGPTSVAAPSSQPRATFDAASCAGPRTYAGINVATTGRVVVTARSRLTAPAYASTCGAPVASATANGRSSRPTARSGRWSGRAACPAGPTSRPRARRRTPPGAVARRGRRWLRARRRSRTRPWSSRSRRRTPRRGTCRTPRAAVPHPAHESSRRSPPYRGGAY